jgi:peptidoglycan/LPS O-acetylase OafA/YrhL
MVRNQERFSVGAMLDYATARFGRVYPLFAVVVLIASVLSYFPPRVPFGFQSNDLLPHLFLFGDGFTVWTISVEFQFYAIFVVIWVITSYIEDKTWGLALLAGIFTASIFMANIYSNSESSIDIRRYLHLFIGGVALAFCLGSNVHFYIVRGARAALPILLTYYFVAFFAIPLMYPQGLVYSDLFTIAACASLVAAVIIAQDSSVAKLLGCSPLVWLGEISFGVYLLHRIVQWLIARFEFLEENPLVRIALTIALTLIAAQLANAFIEKPSRDIVRRWGGKAKNNLLAGRVPNKGVV